jgi:peptidoglycan/LPS O-acetylase OafA/YrhL
MKSIQYRPEIDGLRALAVLPVILFHLGVAWLPGGFVGVDVFFVISGFLITRIIVKEHQQGHFTFISFWSRRARRILPVLLTVTFVTLIANFLFGYRNANSSLGLQAISALFSFSNVFMWRMASDYWGPQAETLPFLHCWSLSVEEQFYLIFPFILIWLLRKKERLILPDIAPVKWSIRSENFNL